MAADWDMGVQNQLELEKRSDILVYTSSALERDIEVTGRVILHLFASTSAVGKIVT